MSRLPQTTVPHSTRGPARKAAGAVGAVFLPVGVPGFIPGITTLYDARAWAGPDSRARLLDLFQVSALHNVSHLFFGAAGLAAALPARDRKSTRLNSSHVAISYAV